MVDLNLFSNFFFINYLYISIKISYSPQKYRHSNLGQIVAPMCPGFECSDM